MPQTKTIKGTIERAYGKDLKEYGLKDAAGNPLLSLAFETNFEELQKGEDIPADERPNEDDILALVNNARKANARQKKQSEVLKDYGVEKPEVGKDMEFTFKQMLNILKATFKDKDEATLRQMANANLGTNF